MILQTNRAGGFLLLSEEPTSRYEGLFFRQGNSMFKTVAQLELPGEINTVRNDFATVKRERDVLTETFCMPDGKDALIYMLDKTAEVVLTLDCREMHDHRQWGRKYSLSLVRKSLVISYRKKNDPRDGSSNMQEYAGHLAIFGEGLQYQPIDAWKEQYYSRDRERNSWPWSKWVFQACKMRVKEIVFAYSKKKDTAIDTAKQVYSNRKKLIAEKKKRIAKILNTNASAIAAVDSLAVGDSYYAGLPWFTQFWARDEIISTRALMISGQYAAAKKVLWKYLALAGNATLPSFEGANNAVASADGICWLFYRIGEMTDKLTAAEKKQVLQKLKSSLDALFSQSQDGLIVNKENETWMDTIGRAGARIEIQAGVLAMLELLGRLGKKDPREQKLKDAVRKNFFTKGTLKDGKEDPILRPNLFLAALFYPKLLTKQEWTKCFDKALKALWLNWGGLSTIDKKNPAFTPKSTGENPKSYHNGDSWFWVNNIAALVLHRTDKKKYSKQIKAILNASIKEQKEMGVRGHCAEISSAKKLASEGCWSQLWSNATLAELHLTISQTI